MNAPTEDAPDGCYHAWYSKKQNDIAGFCFYNLRDGGDEVITTEVKSSKEPSRFDDAKYLGLVDESTGSRRHVPYKSRNGWIE